MGYNLLIRSKNIFRNEYLNPGSNILKSVVIITLPVTASGWGHLLWDDNLEL